MTLSIGKLSAVPALERPDLLAPAVAAALAQLADLIPADQVGVAEIDPELADTAAFCAEYGVELTSSANCVVVAGLRDGQTKMAACMVLATTRADVNGLVKRELDVRKASFAAMESAVELTGRSTAASPPSGCPLTGRCSWTRPSPPRSGS